MYINKYTHIISVCALITSIWHVFKYIPSESPVFIPLIQTDIPKKTSPGPIGRNAYLAGRRVKEIQKTHTNTFHLHSERGCSSRP